MNLLIFWIILLHSSAGPGQGSTCPTFGTDQSSRLSRSHEQKIFMNFDSPAQCRGNVTGWRFCYYRNVDDEDDIEDISSSRIFAALFIVYRRQSANSSNYVPVPGSVREKRIEWRVIQRSSFQCMDENLPLNAYFEIQKNDIIGACIRNSISTDPLLLVGTSSGTNFHTYQWNRFGYNFCHSSQYDSVDTTHEDYRLQQTSTLHLYANIVVADSCTAGSNIAAAIAVTSGFSGTYLNMESRVSCNNHITKWHYCYYPQAATPGSTLSMTVAVWSLDVATNTYIVNPSGIKNITLQPVQTFAKIFCIEESLDDSEYVTVSPNDVIGAILPLNMAIPILGSNANPSIALKTHSQTEIPFNISNSELQSLTSYVLHLYATVEMINIPTTMAVTETETTMAESTKANTTMANTSADPVTSEPTNPVTSEPTNPVTSEPTNSVTSEPTNPMTSEPTNPVIIDPTHLVIINQTDNVATKTDPITEISTEPTSDTNSELLVTSEPTSRKADRTNSDFTFINVVNFSDQDTQQDSFASGNILAIIFSLLIVAIATVLIILFAFYWKKKRKIRKSFSLKPGFENLLYEENDYHDLDDIPMEEMRYQSYDYISEIQTLTSDKKLQESNNENLYSPIDTVEAYYHELEKLKSGRATNGPETIYTDPGHTEEELYSFLKHKNIYKIPGDSIRAYEPEGYGSHPVSHPFIQSTAVISDDYLPGSEKTHRIGNVLGSGNFGTVYEGQWTQNSEQSLNVALKYPKENATKADRVKFLQEAVIMAQFQHPNVVALYGVSTTNSTTTLIVELLSKGDLCRYLQSLQPDPGELVPSTTPRLLLQFSQQICLGMNYLANIGFIHRDLASRNVLISDSFICKISDFGMSRDLNDSDYYTSTGGRIPLKWTAPEAIHYKKYSTASDVWSYGCVLYEIWSLGHKPFETIGNMEVLEIIETETRLAPPPGCPRRIYEIMMQCWAPKANQRPNFRDILLSMLENEELVLHVPQDDSNPNPQATVLGAPLQMGMNMYEDLQKTYNH